jgi:hypothetical protein
MKEIHLNYFIHKGQKIYFKERILITPYRSEDNELWIAEYKPLDIYVFEYTKKLLKQIVYEDLSVMYEFFVLEDDSKLTKGAQDLKYKILEHIKE